MMCRICDVVLTDDNWNPSYRKNGNYICKKCIREYNHMWYQKHSDEVKIETTRWKKENPDKAKEHSTKAHRKEGHQPFNENKKCTMFLGIHIAERILRNVFNHVKQMPMNNPGYDVVCNRDRRIDIKSACFNKRGSWAFNINHNTIADYFLCLALDNRQDLNPMHIWLLPSDKFNHLTSASICPSTVQKWDTYKLDISKVSACCNSFKNKQVTED